MNITSHQADYVEQVGRSWESIAGTRTAGRIVGWLMICEPAHQSSADLVESLGISAGSVSTQIRFLEQLGIVQRVTFPGDRARYYELPPDVWSKVIHEEHNRMLVMRKLAEAGTNVLPRSRPERVTELAEVTGFLIDEWPSLMDRLARAIDKGTS